MQILLVQHGEARSDKEDPGRPLTGRGRDDCVRVARCAASWGVTVPEIYHSGKLRAQQTAEIFKSFLSPQAELIETLWLAPNDDPIMSYGFIRDAKKPLMMIGHLPHLSRLVSLLLTGRGDETLVSFRMGGIVCLEREGENISLGWILTPDLVAY